MTPTYTVLQWKIFLQGLVLFVPQGEWSDGGSGGESSAAADGDNSGDAGRPAGGGDSSREETPK